MRTSLPDPSNRRAVRFPFNFQSLCEHQSVFAPFVNFRATMDYAISVLSFELTVDISCLRSLDQTVLIV